MCGGIGCSRRPKSEVYLGYRWGLGYPELHNKIETLLGNKRTWDWARDSPGHLLFGSEETKEALTSNVNETTEKPNRVQREKQSQVFPADSEGVPVIQLQVSMHREPQVFLNFLAQLVQQMLFKSNGELFKRTLPLQCSDTFMPWSSERTDEKLTN